MLWLIFFLLQNFIGERKNKCLQAVLSSRRFIAIVHSAVNNNIIPNKSARNFAGILFY